MNLNKLGNWFFVLFIACNILLALGIVSSRDSNIFGQENFVVYTVEASLEGDKTFYNNPEVAPFPISQYNPFYYILCHHSSKLFGYKPSTDTYQIYLVCRFISSIFFFIGLFFLWKILSLFQNKANWINQAAIISACVATAPFFYVARPDAMVTCFLFMAIYYFLKSDFGEKKSALLLVGILCFACFFSKQNGAMASIIIGSWLLINKSFVKIAYLIAGFFMGGIIGALLYFPHHSDFLFQNIVEGLKNGFSWRNLVYPIRQFLTSWAIIPVLSLAIYFWYKKERTVYRRVHFIAFALLVNLSLTFLSCFKFGADQNYFSDAIILGFLLLAILVQKLISDYNISKPNIFLNALFVAFVFLGFAGMAKQKVINIFIAPTTAFGGEGPESSALGRYLSNEIQQDPNLYFMEFDDHLNTYFPKNVLFPQLFIHRVSEGHNDFKFNGFEDLIKSGRLKYYYSKQEEQKVLGQEFGRHFKFEQKFGPYTLYKNIHLN